MPDGVADHFDAKIPASVGVGEGKETFLSLSRMSYLSSARALGTVLQKQMETQHKPEILLTRYAQRADSVL
jgi:hypothetical protein